MRLRTGREGLSPTGFWFGDKGEQDEAHVMACPADGEDGLAAFDLVVGPSGRGAAWGGDGAQERVDFPPGEAYNPRVTWDARPCRNVDCP